jgi:hypothetical protein
VTERGAVVSRKARTRVLALADKVGAVVDRLALPSTGEITKEQYYGGGTSGAPCYLALITGGDAYERISARLERLGFLAAPTGNGPQKVGGESPPADLEQRVTATEWWRWGESNPRPLLWSCAFYGRSQ